MRLHIDLLGYLHLLWGAFGMLSGISLAVLAVGTNVAAVELGLVGAPQVAAIWIFVICAVVLAGFGVTMALIGRALQSRWPRGRVAALVLAVPNLAIVPFGTALGVYTFWVLQNDDARGQFQHPVARPAPRTTWTEHH
jgi:hypothetical protein